MDKNWWFRRAWFFKQTYGQLIVGSLAMLAVIFWIVSADEAFFRLTIGVYLGFQAFDFFADMIRADEPPRT
jgi:hypothetical protein